LSGTLSTGVRKAEVRKQRCDQRNGRVALAGHAGEGRARVRRVDERYAIEAVTAL
jgi:hypothetical protein